MRLSSGLKAPHVSWLISTAEELAEKSFISRAAVLERGFSHGMFFARPSPTRPVGRFWRHSGLALHRGNQLHHPDQIVGRRHQAKLPVHSQPSPQLGLPQSAHGLDPAKYFLHQTSLLLAAAEL